MKYIDIFRDIVYRSWAGEGGRGGGGESSRNRWSTTSYSKHMNANATKLALSKT